MKTKLLFLITLVALIPSLVLAQVTTATSTTIITVTNPGIAQDRTTYYAPLSSQSLIDTGFLDADGLNQQLLNGSSAEVPFMPSTGSIAPQRLQADDGGVFTNEIASNGTVDALTLLPAAPATGDAYYFGSIAAYRVLRLEISTAGVGTWTVTWEYFNGSTWVALPNVTDGTNSFRNSGTRTVSWDLPVAMPQSTVNSLASHYVRARVTAFTGLTTQPLGKQVWTDTGYYAAFAGNIPANNVSTNTLYTVGPAEARTFHHYFPGSAGVTTPDAADLEPGVGTWELDYQGYVDTENAGNIVVKTNSLTLSSDGAGTINGMVNVDTTTNFSSSASDGHIVGVNAVYGDANAAVTGVVDDTAVFINVGQNDSVDYEIFRGYLFFSTAALPDAAVILSASLQFVCIADGSATDFDIVVQNGQPTYPTDPLAAGDYDRTNYADDGGSLTTAGIVCDSVTVTTIPLNATGISWVNLTGATKLVLRSSRDISITQPSGSELIAMTSANGSPAPLLGITYATTTTVSQASVTSGEHRVRFGTDATNLYLTLDAGTPVTTPKVAVVNTANDWSFAADPDVTKYAEYMKYTVAGTQEVWYELEALPAATMTDRSGNAHTGTPSYPTSFGTLQVAMGSLTPTGATVTVSGPSVEPLPDILPPQNQNLSQSGGDLSTLPFNALIDDMSTAAQLPSLLFYLLLAYGTTGASIFLILWKVPIESKYLIAAFVSTAILAFWYSIGAVPQIWPVVTMAMLWAVICFWAGRNPSAT